MNIRLKIKRDITEIDYNLSNVDDIKKASVKCKYKDIDVIVIVIEKDFIIFPIENIIKIEITNLN